MATETDFDELGRRRICIDCVGDPYLANDMESDDQEAKCFYCSNHLPSWSLKEVSERVELAFNQHFTRTSDQPDGFQSMMLSDKESDYEWYRDGDPTDEAISYALNCSSSIAKDVQMYLEEQHGNFEAWQLGEECEFASDAHYEEIMPSDADHHYEWHQFEKALKQETRFFNQEAHGYLSSIFSDLDKMKTEGGHPVIVEAGPNHEIKSFFRARVFYSEEQLIEALKRPDLQLGPPPATYASAGRMNARGISVFYGADSPDGALAEVRPTVGSQTLIGKFNLVRSIKLLDLRALRQLSEKVSIFDPAYADRLSRMMFLRSLKDRITRPVMPTDEEFEYLLTQGVIDFLANGISLDLDGVIFPSSQTNEATTNVVLFHHSSKVEELEFPEGTELDAHTFMTTEDGAERDYWVWEDVPAEGNVAKKEADELESEMAFASLPLPASSADECTSDYTLRVDLDSLTVRIVESTSFITDDYSVRRHRFNTRSAPF